jgi:hypothetical protein
MSPARFESRQLLIWFGACAGLLSVLAWPRAPVTAGFSEAFCKIGNPLLERLEFGNGGRVALMPAREQQRQVSDSVAADTTLRLRVDGYNGDLPFGMSLRRDAYLPLVILVAVISTAPLRLRPKLGALVLGALVVWALSLGAVCLAAVWIFAERLARVYELPAHHKDWIDLAYRALLLPPSNRFIIPIVVGVGLVFWLKQRSALPAPAL